SKIRRCVSSGIAEAPFERLITSETVVGDSCKCSAKALRLILRFLGMPPVFDFAILRALRDDRKLLCYTLSYGSLFHQQKIAMFRFQSPAGRYSERGSKSIFCVGAVFAQVEPIMRAFPKAVLACGKIEILRGRTRIYLPSMSRLMESKSFLSSRAMLSVESDSEKRCSISRAIAEEGASPNVPSEPASLWASSEALRFASLSRCPASRLSIPA